MEENKILKVLEKVPSGTKLYSTAFGKLEFNGIVATIDGSKIELATWSDICITYFSDGKYRKEGEITLYPSKEMRDWDKFAWKKGDVLRRESDKTMVLFEKFTDDTYTTFFGKYFCKEASITSAERKVLIGIIIAAMGIIPVCIYVCLLLIVIGILACNVGSDGKLPKYPFENV